MILSFLLALLAFVTLLTILTPLLRGSRPQPMRASFDQAVYRDQLQELDRDIARSLITPAEAEAARLEIQRRMLAADRRPAAPPRLARSPVLAAIVCLLVTLGSLASYLWLGAPGVPDVPFSTRKAELAHDNGPGSLQQAADSLAAKVRQNPNDAQGWLLYGRSLALLGQWDHAEDAYSHAMALGETGPDVTGDRAEMMVMQAGGVVTPAARAAFQQVLAADAKSGLARYYLAIAAMQAGQPRQAIDGMQALLTDLPDDSPMRTEIARRITDAAQAAGVPVPQLAKGTTSQPAPGPDANAMAEAAKLPDAQRQAMIRGMVDKLAAQQQANPSNLDGWLRLGRAYAVLHEPDKAADAYDQATRLKPNDTAIPLQEVQALLSQHGPTDKLSPRVVGLLKRVEATDPNQPMMLWYLGLAAAQDANKDAADGYWRRLLTKVPPGGDEAKMIQAAIDALDKH